MPYEQRKIPSFVDFEIEIENGDAEKQEYSLAVRSQSGEVRETLKFPFGAAELDSRLKDIQIALLHSAVPNRQALSTDEKNVREFGRLLFDALMVGNVGNSYALSQVLAREQEKGLRLRLRINPPELAALPWEFLYDSRRAEFVCLSRNTPLTRYIDVSLPVNPIFSKLPLRILGMLASPADKQPLNVKAEKKRVNDALAQLIETGQVELIWLEGGTWQDLFNAMSGGPWHIFHFIGHGGYDRARDEGTLLFEGPDGNSDPMSATHLARLLADHASLRLVLMNSCEGARGGKEDLFSSSASILVRRGIPAVLAMQYEISDEAALTFSNYFYQALAQGMPVDAAVNDARIELSIARDNTLEWVTPVLYLRAPNGLLFQIDNDHNVLSPQTTPEPKNITPEIPETIPFIEKRTIPAIPTSEAPQPENRPEPSTGPKKTLKPGANRFLMFGAGGLGLVVLASFLFFGAMRMLPVATSTPTSTQQIITATPTQQIITVTATTPITEVIPPTPEPSAAPMLPTTDPISLDPVKTVDTYWNYFGDGNFTDAWNYFSAGFQQRNYSNNLQSYLDAQTQKYCDVSLREPRVITITPQTVYVLGSVIFQSGSGCSETTSLLIHQVTLANSRWVIDRVMNGVQADSKCALSARRLSVGIKARVSTRSDPLVMRAFPGATETQYALDRINANTEVPVLDGPLCGTYKNAYYWWWKVRSPGGVEAWVVEGSDASDPIFIKAVP